MAVSLDGWLWDVSSLVVKIIKLRCLTDMYVVNITPNVQIVSVKNGCKGYSPNMYNSAKSELTGSVETST